MPFGTFLLPGQFRAYYVCKEGGTGYECHSLTLSHEWRRLLHDVGRGTRVTEVCGGWVEKQTGSGRWKPFYLLLLTTHELVLLQNERATQPKHILDLTAPVGHTAWTRLRAQRRQRRRGA